MEVLSFIVRLLFASSVRFCIFFLEVSSATNISDDVFVFDSSHGYSSISRSLLQARKGCPLNVEFLNYSIVTDKCIGPMYPPEKCCAALKQFACPYVDEMNDLSTGCASAMFSYINLYGNYPEGLFASECHEGKMGISCGNYSSSSTDADSYASAAAAAAAATTFGCCSFSLLLSLIPRTIILLLLI